MDLPTEIDPIVAEVWRIREEIAAKFDYDYDRIAEYARQQAKRMREQVAARGAEPAD